MTELTRDKLYSKFRDIRESTERLAAFKHIPLDEFLKDRDKQDVASFRLIVATEAAIDVCLHIAAKVLKKVPEEYAGCFQLLGDNEVIDRELATQLVRMARFRNLLVHQYWKIDYARLYQIITGDEITSLETFIGRVNAWIERRCAENDTNG